MLVPEFCTVIVPVLEMIPRLSIPVPAVFDTLIVPELERRPLLRRILVPPPEIVMVPELESVPLLSIPAEEVDIVIVPWLTIFPEFGIPVPIPVLDMTIEPPTSLIKKPEEELSMPSVEDVIMIIPELLIFAEFMKLDETVTVIPEGIMKLSPEEGEKPPHVAESFQFPF